MQIVNPIELVVRSRTSRILLMTVVLVGVFLMGPTLADEPQASLVLEKTIPLEHVSGRIDHMAIDLGRRRLFIAELGNNTIDVVDLGTDTVVHRIRGVKEPQGIGYSEKTDQISVASAADGSVRMFQGLDLAPVGTIDLHQDADNVRIDPRNGNIVVGYGDGGLSIIDPARRVQLGTVPLEGHPESFQIELVSGRIFVNVPKARQIAVVDLDAHKQLATWRVPGLGANFPMALGQRNVLATVFRTPPRLVLLNRDTGGVIAKARVCGDADDVFFDDKRDRIYVSCGSGEVAVFQRTAGGYSSLPPVSTAGGARTSLFVAKLDRLFVAKRAGLMGSKAAILVYRPD